MRWLEWANLLICDFACNIVRPGPIRVNIAGAKVGQADHEYMVPEPDGAM